MEQDKDKIVCIHQPSYFPWLGLLHKISNSDIFVLMDEVQLSDRGFQHRNTLLTNKGDEKFITINISKKDYRTKHIKDLIISDTNWRHNHLNFIRENYRKHPFYDEIVPILIQYYSSEHKFLIDALLSSIKLSLELFSINTEIVLMSELDYNKNAKKSDLILSLIKTTNSTAYLSGKGALAYMSTDDFVNSNIKLLIQEFIHPVYPQYNLANMHIGLSNIDYLFNCGLSSAKHLFYD